MVFRNFRIICIIRVILICGTVYLFFYLLFQTRLFATTLIVGITSVYQVIALIHYVEKTNRDLTRFLRSIRYSDFSQTFTTTVKGLTFKNLNSAFNDVIKEFQKTRTEKEEHFRYLQTVVQHVGIGLMAFTANGDIELINNAAKRLLKIRSLRNIRQLESTSEQLVSKLLKLKTGEKHLVKLQEPDNILQLSIYGTEFILHQQKYTLVALQNIQSELEEKEMEAWQNLIRVLTHEIMNSITPISSLAATASSLLTGNSGFENPDSVNENIKDVRNAVKTIERRSKGLLDFVENYRKLTRIPKPDYEIFPVYELFDRVGNLMKDQFEKNSIEFKIKIDPESLEITTDPNLIEQVLINLCKNSVEAVIGRDKPIIELIARTGLRGELIIQAIDNGSGINPELTDKIFIPFFTTKKDGSGIGLSISKQIMRQHGGTLTVNSKPYEETRFTLRF